MAVLVGLGEGDGEALGDGLGDGEVLGDGDGLVDGEVLGDGDGLGEGEPMARPKWPIRLLVWASPAWARYGRPKRSSTVLVMEYKSKKVPSCEPAWVYG